MKRWERPLLLFSIALNVGFVSLAAIQRAPRPAGPPLMGPDSPRAAAQMQRWQKHRHQAVARALDLDTDQRQRFGSSFDEMRPRLRSARREVVAERTAYGEALAAGDAGAARAAQRRLSRAQARVDSLCAEMMVQEATVLRPEQRARYVRWMFRPGMGPGPSRPQGHGPGGPHRHGMPGDPVSGPGLPGEPPPPGAPPLPGEPPPPAASREGM
jgi:Spy/CpxP family protein refolding chaperone